MFRILSIDGGGIKGAFPAAFLCAVQEVLQGPIADYFDLIAGTSTGGIIALGLGLGLSPSEILKFYTTSGTAIFPASQKWSTRVKHYFTAKYSSDPLQDALRLAFGDRILGQSRQRLLISSFSALTGKIYVYKTPHHVRFESDWRKSAVEVAMATSAAPSYFPPYIAPNYIAHLDGGMWANNPTGSAVAEAVGILRVNPAQIRVLSLGCTCTAQSFVLQNVGMLAWRKKALDAAFIGQSFGSMGIAASLVGHSNIQRVDPTVEDGRFSLDDNIVGESGTGKTSVLASFRDKHKPMRHSNGMEVPILYATVPSMPTVKSLATVMLEALGAPDSNQGTENERSRRLRVLMTETGTRMVMIDEFQHFIDRGRQKIIHDVADWLKVLIDETRSTLVVAGLPSCKVVIDANEQLARRFLAAIRLPRFSWNDLRQREEFIDILGAFHEEIAKEYAIPDLYSEAVAFRFFLATGGLIGYLSKLLRQALRNAAADGKKSIVLGDLHAAHMQSIWTNEVSELPKPFESDFVLVESNDLLDRANKIGRLIDLQPTATRRKLVKPVKESINSILVTR